MSKRWERVGPTMRGATPGLVGLGSTRKQDEQAIKTKPTSSTPPRCLFQFLPPVSCPV